MGDATRMTVTIKGER